MAVTRCRNCLALLIPGTEVCPCCKAPVQQVKVRHKRTKSGKRNPVEFLWLVTAAVIVFVLLLQVVAWRGSQRRAVILAGLGDRPADESSLIIWPIIERQYPDLAPRWQNRDGTHFVGIPELFWKSMHPNERTQLASDIDALCGSQDWVVVTGPHLGRGRLAPRDRHPRSEFFEVEPVIREPLAEFAAVRMPGAVKEAPTSAASSVAQEAPEMHLAASTEESVGDVAANPALEYEILFKTDDPLGRRAYAEVLVPTLSQDTPSKERRHVARTIADLEGLDDVALYCTREARQAHYSMDYAESHPLALQTGFLGTLDRGRFKPYRSQQ